MSVAQKAAHWVGLRAEKMAGAMAVYSVMQRAAYLVVHLVG